MRFFLIPILIIYTTNIFADVMRVTILGSGTPRPDINRFSQSILIEAADQKLLFDSGRGATIRLSQANVSIGDINTIFLDSQISLIFSRSPEKPSTFVMNIASKSQYFKVSKIFFDIVFKVFGSQSIATGIIPN